MFHLTVFTEWLTDTNRTSSMAQTNNATLQFQNRTSFFSSLKVVFLNTTNWINNMGCTYLFWTTKKHGFSFNSTHNKINQPMSRDGPSHRCFSESGNSDCSWFVLWRGLIPSRVAPHYSAVPVLQSSLSKGHMHFVLATNRMTFRMNFAWGEVVKVLITRSGLVHQKIKQVSQMAAEQQENVNFLLFAWDPVEPCQTLLSHW